MTRLRSSKTNPSGTCSVPWMSIQLSSGAEMSISVKTAQLQTKLATTAAIEIPALRFLNRRRVKSVITAAEINGKSKTSHGRELFVVNLKISGW